MLLFAACSLYLACRLWPLWSSRRERTRAWWIGVGTALLAVIGILIALASDILAQKALALLLMPAGLTWMLLIALTVACWRRAPRAIAVLASTALALFTLAGNPWLGDALISTLERRIPSVELENVQPFDAVCVLGGGSEINDDGPSLSDGGDRLALAARLWHAGKAGVLVVSGHSIAGMERERDLAEEAIHLLRGMGVDPRAIVRLPTRAVNTTQEIAGYAALVREQRWNRVGLASSAWHLPRALRLCRAAELEVVPLGADRRGRFRGWSPYWLIPQEHGFKRVQQACWEYLGMLAGR